MSDMTLLRIGIAIAMALLLGAIIFFGRGRKNGRDKRVSRESGHRDAGRIEPGANGNMAETLGEGDATQEELHLEGSPSQAELGKRVGLTRQTIAAIEQERYSPTLDVAFRIAHVFGKRIEDVFHWTPPEGGSG